MAEAQDMWRCQMVNCGYVYDPVATDATRSLPVPNSRTFLMTGAVRSVARQRKVSVASRKKISIQARTPFGASFL